ncbi:MAG: hypothetical protein NC898_02405 [Candidatus Omnitrophica bacterium]|nr:hypothetical protein [Candidatus Omnitrophota bacterium]MCM8793304.1 hypothetical protein [Candidatus Omnitrophota bacterium]
MKKEQVQVLGLAGLVFIFLAWALQLNSSLKNLKREKKILEEKLNQTVKERDFMHARIEEMEKKLAEEKKANALLIEQLELAKNTIEELQGKILEIAREKEAVEKELLEVKNKTILPQETVEPEIPLTSPPAQPSASPEEGSSPSEELIPEF